MEQFALTQNTSLRLRAAPQAAMVCAVLGLAICALPFAARAQSIDPDTMTPRANGTDLVQTTLSFDRFGSLNFTNGTSYPKSHYDSYAATISLGH
jgi:hypothetical protein